MKIPNKSIITFIIDKVCEMLRNKKMKGQKKEAIWNILNNFRMKYFFSEPTAQINVGDFDKMMNEAKKKLNF
jgi:hypothetical protein